MGGVHYLPSGYVATSLVSSTMITVSAPRGSAPPVFMRYIQPSGSSSVLVGDRRCGCDDDVNTVYDPAGSEAKAISINCGFVEDWKRDVPLKA